MLPAGSMTNVQSLMSSCSSPSQGRDNGEDRNLIITKLWFSSVRTRATITLLIGWGILSVQRLMHKKLQLAPLSIAVQQMEPTNSFACLAVSSSDDSEVDEVEGMPATANDNAQPECRICHEPDEVHNLISPCACSGSVRYVHASCLHEWRQMSVTNLAYCNVCGVRYTFLRSFPTSVCEWLCSRARDWRRMRTWWNMWRRCKGALESGRSPSCCALRLALQALFLLFSVVQGRLLLLLGAHAWSAAGEWDAALDRALLPESVFRALESFFPALNAWHGVQSVAFVESLTSMQVRFTCSDLCVGALISSLNCHLYALWCHSRGQQPPLLPCPVHDAADLWEALFPLPEQAASFSAIVLPLLIYAARKLLAWCADVPMEALPLSFTTGEGLGLHIVLGLGLGVAMLMAFELGDFVVQDFAVWSSTAEQRAVATRERRRRRRTAAAAVGAGAAVAAV